MFLPKGEGRRVASLGRSRIGAIGTGLAAALMLLGGSIVGAKAQDLVPPPVDLSGIVLNEDLAIVLGKALFYDERIGSSILGNQSMSCAGCHFSAGADSRITNVYNPGFNDITKGPGGDVLFGAEYSTLVDPGETVTGAVAGPNYTLTPGDMPAHVLSDPLVRDSELLYDTNDRVSSPGALPATGSMVGGRGRTETCVPVADEDTPFSLDNGLVVRNVEPRNTPTFVNAAFNHRNFWDGRANNIFNGFGVFGLREVGPHNPKGGVVKRVGAGLQLTHLEIEDASLASQAVGPIFSFLEMACADREPGGLGKMFLAGGHRPLEDQTVHPNDSVFAGRIHPSGLGLSSDYETLIRQVFHPDWWSKSGRWVINESGQVVRPPRSLGRDGGYRQIELNFPMFFGITVMLWERTQIADQTYFHQRIADGTLALTPPTPGRSCFNPQDPDAINTDPVVRGCDIFFGVPFGPPQNQGPGCALFCHSGDLFTSAGFQAGEEFDPVVDVFGTSDLGDEGFFSVGQQPAFTDRIVGGKDPWGNPLSFAREYKAYLASGKTDLPIDPIVSAPGETLGVAADAVDPGDVNTTVGVEVDSASKTPSLINVALTAPYFSWGQYPTLRAALDFYNRGGNTRTFSAPDVEAHEHIVVTGVAGGCASGDNTGTGPLGEGDYPLPPGSDCGSNLNGFMTPLGLSEQELDDLVEFLKSLTDRRVQCNQAPFNTPSLHIVAGHTETDTNGDGYADDIIYEMPATGDQGFALDSGHCLPNEGDLFAQGAQVRAGGPLAPPLE